MPTIDQEHREHMIAVDGVDVVARFCRDGPQSRPPGCACGPGTSARRLDLDGACREGFETRSGPFRRGAWPRREALHRARPMRKVLSIDYTGWKAARGILVVLEHLTT
jgi:hypothetical protein